MRYITFDLDEFMKNIYQTTEEEVFGGDAYIDFLTMNDWRHLKPDQEELQKAQSLLSETVDVDILKNAVYKLKEQKYCSTYFENANEKWRKAIEDKIEADFEYINDIFSPWDELVEGVQISIHSINWEERTITLEGVKRLECSIINCINGVGLFRYDSLKDFRETCDGYSTHQRLSGHLAWLHDFEKIYGTHKNCFHFKDEYVWRYIYGDERYTAEELKDEVENELAMVRYAS